MPSKEDLKYFQAMPLDIKVLPYPKKNESVV